MEPTLPYPLIDTAGIHTSVSFENQRLNEQPTFMNNPSVSMRPFAKVPSFCDKSSQKEPLNPCVIKRFGVRILCSPPLQNGQDKSPSALFMAASIYPFSSLSTEIQTKFLASSWDSPLKR